MSDHLFEQAKGTKINQVIDKFLNDKEFKVSDDVVIENM